MDDGKHPLERMTQIDEAEAEPSDEEKDRAICEQCGGTGIAPWPPRPANDRCWWCEGRGYRL